MEIPEYNINDLKMAERDGEFIYVEFDDFVNGLIDRDMIDDTAEKGILAFVKENGTAKLSPKQKYRLEKIVEEYGTESCTICSEEIPFNEVLDFDENDRLCGYHKHQMDKDH